MMIRTAVVAALMTSTAWLNAQNTAVKSAEFGLSSGNAEGVLEAKQYIDKAANHEATRNAARMWLVRAMVYTRVVEYSGNELLKGQTSGAGYVSAYSMSQFWKSPEKKRFDDVENARLETRNSFGVAFNEAEDVVTNRLYDSAVKYYQLILFLHSQLDTADVGELERKNGLSYKYLTERMATIATYCTDTKIKTEVLTELMDKGSKSPVVYEALSRVYLEAGDTAMAEKVVRRALEVSPGDNAMFQILVNYYVTIDRVDLLFDDVNKQIEASPNSRLYYTRGYLYERRNDFENAMKDYRSAIEYDEFNYDAQYNLGVALLKYESGKLYEKKSGASGAARAEIDKQLKAVFTEAREHLELASENKSYSLDDQINIFKALKTAALELDDKEGADYYQSKIDALEAAR